MTKSGPKDLRRLRIYGDEGRQHASRIYGQEEQGRREVLRSGDLRRARAIPNGADSELPRQPPWSISKVTSRAVQRGNETNHLRELLAVGARQATSLLSAFENANPPITWLRYHHSQVARDDAR